MPFNDMAKIKLAEGLRIFLTSDDGGTAKERTARQRGVCAPLEWLLQELMEGQAGWDPRYSWIDGIKPDSITRTAEDAVRLDGLAILVDGEKWRYRPVQADLALPPTPSTIRFAAPSDEFPYSPRPRHTPPTPATWPYLFDVVLAAL